MQRLVTAAVVLACAAGLGSAQCAEGWVNINNDCFGFVEAVALNWTESNSHCEALGGTSAQIDSATTFRGVYAYIQTYGLPGSFWLGGSDSAIEGDWTWLDNSRVLRGTPFWALESGAFNWAQEPQGGTSENCLAMDEERSHYWDDKDCANLYQPLCML